MATEILPTNLADVVAAGGRRRRSARWCRRCGWRWWCRKTRWSRRCGRRWWCRKTRWCWRCGRRWWCRKTRWCWRCGWRWWCRKTRWCGRRWWCRKPGGAGGAGRPGGAGGWWCGKPGGAGAERELVQVEAVLVQGHRPARLAVALRTKSVIAAHHPDLVPLLAAEEDLAAVAETMRAPAAAEAVIAWEAADTVAVAAERRWRRWRRSAAAVAEDAAAAAEDAEDKGTSMREDK